MHPQVFSWSIGIICLLLAVALFRAEDFEEVSSAIQGQIAEKAGWLYVLAVNCFLFLVIYLACSRYGRIRLGGDDSRPEYSRLSWFAMLFSAGMGIGLVFYGVAEPVLHYGAPPEGEPGTAEAARTAMAFSFLHWGFHAWGIYALVGLALAYFGYRYKLPLTIRSALYPLAGERIRGGLGNVVDVLAVVATLFGVATSLGLGAQQILTGMEFLSGGGEKGEEPGFLGLNRDEAAQILIIACITAMATGSVVLGLSRGIRRLSMLNFFLAGLLLVFVFLAGPTWFLADSFVQNVGEYLHRLPRIGFWAESFHGAAGEGGWQEGWTIFYWGWWIAWSPFVGMFIARISKGRTIREFVAGVLLAPALVTFLWMSVFGGSALHGALQGDAAVVDAVNEDVSTSLFVLLRQYPLAGFTCLLGIVVVVIFFVTSSDSASLVIDIVTAGGDPDPPVWQRVFWAVTEGLVAALLLVLGGLQALQAASIATGLPFAVVLLLMSAGLLKALRQEKVRPRG